MLVVALCVRELFLLWAMGLFGSDVDFGVLSLLEQLRAWVQEPPRVLELASFCA